MCNDGKFIRLEAFITIVGETYKRDFRLYAVPSMLKMQADSIVQSISVEISAIARMIRISERAQYGYVVSVRVDATYADQVASYGDKVFELKTNSVKADSGRLNLEQWIILTAVSWQSFATAMDGI